MNPYRKIFSFLISTCICFCINISSNYAQSNVVPNQINYQAIAHSSNGQTLNSETIDVLVGVYAQSPSGTLVYQEEHSTTTNDYGLFTLLIGDGFVTAAGTFSSFSNVEWQNDVYFLNIQIDVGFGYENLGTQQLVTVPYAFHARTVEFDNVNDLDSDPTNEIQSLSISNNTLFLTQSNDSVTIPVSSYNAGLGIDITNGVISNSGDNDNDPTNELIQNAALSPQNDFIIIDQGNGNFVNIDVSDLNNSGTDNQNLSSATLNGSDLTIAIENGDSAVVNLGNLIDDADNDPINELQQLFLSGNELILSLTNDTIILPFTTYSAGTGIDISSGIISNTGDGDFDDTNELISSAVLGPSNNTIVITQGTSGYATTIDVSNLNNPGTDDQNLQGSLNGTNLTIDIDNGTAATVDLGTLQDGTGTDNQNLTGASLSGNTLVIDIENGNSANVDLSALNNSGTDNQNLSGSLNGTNITIDIDNGTSATVDLGPLQDGTGSDDQNLTNATLNGTDLTIEIEDGSAVTVDLSSLGNQTLSYSFINSFLVLDISGGNNISIDMSAFIELPQIGNNLNDVLTWNGTQWVAQAILQSDNQNISGSSFNSLNNELTIGIEDGNSETVDLSALDVDIFPGNGIDITGSVGSFTIENTGDTDPTDDVTSTVTPADGQILVYDVSQSSWVPQNITNDQDWNTSNSGVIYNDSENVGIGLTNPLNKLHVKDNSSTNSLEDIAFFESNNQYSTISLNTLNSGEAGSAFLSKYNNNIVSYFGGSYFPYPAGDTLAFFGVGAPYSGNGNPEIAMKIRGTNGDNKSMKLFLDEISIGMESDIPNGTNRIKISSNEISLVGNDLGAGNLLPTNLLIKGQMIYDDGNQQSGYILQSDGSGTASWADPSSIANDNDWFLNGSDIYNANSGNIGIGTNNPDDKLHIHDPGNTQVKIESSVNGLASLELDAADTKASVDFYDNGTWAGTMGYDVDDEFLFWQEDGYGKILIGKDGKIGIGTNSPQAGLVVSGSSIWNSAIGIENTGSGTEWRMNVNGSNFGITKISGSTFTPFKLKTNGDAQFLNSSGDETVTIFDNGSVGIGTTSTDAVLDIDVSESWSSIYGQKIEIDKQSSGTMYGIASYLERDVSGYSVGIYSDEVNDGSSSAATFALYGYASGNSPGAKYGVFGSTGPLASGTKYGVYCSGNGAYSGSWSSISDLKFKEKIDEYEGALENLMKLQTKTYFFKNNSEYAHMNFSKKRQFGLIAQEVEKIFPELVEDGVHPGQLNKKTNTEAENINFKSMNYIGLIPVLVQSIQEQQEMIEELKKEIEKLKSK